MKLKPMKIKNITQQLEQLAPLQYQEDYDNCGLLLGDHNDDCTGVLICLDITQQIIQEAIQKKCNLVVSHHPLIFKALKQLTPHTTINQIILTAIKNNIAIYAIHTNLDNVKNGVNAAFAQALELEKSEILLPKQNNEIGGGYIGFLKQPLPMNDFLHYVKNKLQVKVIKHTTVKERLIHRVAICGGAGSFLISSALKSNADAMITADIKYSDFFLGQDRLLICDIGHYESEIASVDLIYQYLIGFFPKLVAHQTTLNTNPISYFY